MKTLDRQMSVERGAIVLVQLSRSHKGLYLKRVIGLPGDTVQCRGIYVWINEKMLDEPYVRPESAIQPAPNKRWTLKENEYIILGDTRDDSTDSRRFGPVYLEELEAIGCFRCWPPHRWRLYNNLHLPSR